MDLKAEELRAVRHAVPIAILEQPFTDVGKQVCRQRISPRIIVAVAWAGIPQYGAQVIVSGKIVPTGARKLIERQPALFVDQCANREERIDGVDETDKRGERLIAAGSPQSVMGTPSHFSVRLPAYLRLFVL
jgi:hypothetical protein